LLSSFIELIDFNIVATFNIQSEFGKSILVFHTAIQLKSFIVEFRALSSNNIVSAISAVNTVFTFISNQLFERTVV
jgi:hypothetical protein